MSTIMEVMKTRRSVRKFKSDMVPKELIEQIMEAGTYAASGNNVQVPVTIAVTNADKCNELRKINAKIMGKDETFDPFYGAPVILIVLAKKERRTYVYDGSLVIGNMMLAAESLGIGSCWIHRAKEEFELPEGKAILEKLGIKGDYEGIGHCILGYAAKPAGKAAPRKKDYIYRIG